MTRLLLLDSGPLGELVHASRGAASLTSLARADGRIVIPEICQYELRRELLRLRLSHSLRLLDLYSATFQFAPLTSDDLRQAAILWAEVRQAGRPTADSEALDIDVILAACVLGLRQSGHDAVVVTTNVRHLERLVPVIRWQDLGAR